MVTWNPGCPLRPALLPEAAGRKGGANQACHPWVSRVGTPGEGAPTPLSLPLPGWGRGVACLPLPLCQLLAAFPKHLVGAHWVPGPGWTPVYCCGASGFSQPARTVSPKTRKGLNPGCTGTRAPLRLLLGSQAPRWVRRSDPGPVPGAKEGAGSHQLTPSPMPGLRVRTWWWRQGEGGGVRAKGDGVTRFGGTGGGEGCSLPPPQETGPGGCAARARGQDGPPTQG